MELALAGSDGTARNPELSWDARSYVCHVGDNLRIWAERLVAAAQVPDMRIGAYDGDLLATARNYRAIPLAGALWSLRLAVDEWLSAVNTVGSGGVELLHPMRGRLRLVDAMSTNAHNSYHHVFDVRRIIG